MKKIAWVGSSKKDLLKLPDNVIDFVGYGLFLAQIGKQHSDSKVLKGFGSANVIELIDSDQAGTYRAVYTVKFKEVIFVLHVFQKKSKQGIKTPQTDVELIKSRLKQAELMYKESYGHAKK